MQRYQDPPEPTHYLLTCADPSSFFDLHHRKEFLSFMGLGAVDQ